jgi:cephalosporin hydroxylase/predicted O-methyltransferase YrrM
VFPFWDVAIAPIIEAVGARRVLEIGALRGDTTRRLVEALGPDAELHVVDPTTDFDPADHDLVGRCTVHRAASLDVLPQLPAMDVALIDGDHNWYTVYHELGLLAEAARREHRHLPVLVLHDVGWPYGRRDLYYEPGRIPEEHRHPFAQVGLHPGRTGSDRRGGGLNATMCNALEEGGERNGVMTALDDFTREQEHGLRRVVLPIYFGLAIVAGADRLRETPALTAVLDHLESAAGKDELLELAESLRLRALLHQRKEVAARDASVERGAARYLRLLKGALLDEHYIENEVRLQYLSDVISKGVPLDEHQLRDPVRRRKQHTARLEQARATGTVGPEIRDGASFLPYTDIGRVRLDHLERALDTLRADGVAGDLVECATGRGGGAIFLRGWLEAHEATDRDVWVADEFRVGRDATAGLLDLSADLNQVRDAFARFGLFDERTRLLQGPYHDTLAAAPIERVALLRIGTGSGAVGEILDAVYARVEPGGIVVVDDYVDDGSRRAVDEFRARHGVAAPLERIDWSAVAWRKAASDAEPTGTAPPRTTGHAPIVAPAPPVTVDLSVVVVFFDMRREAARTLHSLSRAYQRGIDDLTYEVIVVENGSNPTEKLGAEYVEGFGPEFRYVDLGADATPSPVGALNHGAALARGRAFAFMIDGAHVLTPGVLQQGMRGLAAYEPAVVVTQQWYVGPGQQGDEMRTGYDQAFEDRLFRRIAWPSDGYRLFEIGHFIGDRDWLDGLWESNCIFVPRALLEQVGAFDEHFALPGGGYANLDFYERLIASPDSTMVTVLGEGSFHQLHGGTTTNQREADDRRQRIVSYSDQYTELRGRNYRGPGKTIHYVGSMRPAALRTRARRLIGPAFGDARSEAAPTEPVPMPDTLRDEFIDAYWHTQAWRRTTWFGVPVGRPPTDLLALQEVVAEVRPDVIVETGSGDGGRAWYLATLCELAGHGRVLTIGASDGAVPHPRITPVPGDALDAGVVQAVHDAVAGGRALVVLGAAADRERTIAEFAAYQDLVPAGSYVVVEDTVLNGHPVRPEFGPGPLEAVKEVIKRFGDFAVDPTLEAHALTFDRMGFLKRLPRPAPAG